MKLTLLLLAVLVSTAFASPYYLKRQRGPGGQQKGQPPSDGSDRQGQGDQNGGNDDSDSDKKGRNACKKVLDDCAEQEEKPNSVVNDDDAIKDMRRRAEVSNAKADCMVHLANENFDDSSAEENECKAILHKCLKPEEAITEKRSFLRLMARTEGGPCKEVLGLGPEDGADVHGDDDDSSEHSPESNDDQLPEEKDALRNELRQLLRDFYRRK